VLGEEHSLVELEAQLGPSAARHAIELGIRTAPVDYRDADPHLFVFAWVAGRRTCYDRCGWQGVGASARPGDSISTRIGTEVTLGVVLHEGAWWAWMDSEWLGACPPPPPALRHSVACVACRGTAGPASRRSARSCGPMRRRDTAQPCGRTGP